MDPTLVADERDRGKDQHDDKDNTLFVFCEFEDLDRAFHFLA
jgi:hypothetical protein